MEKFVIEGGRPLSGVVVPSGNKNGALALLAATLLTDQKVVLKNVPRIKDVKTMLAIMADIGVDIEWSGENEVTVQAQDLTTTRLDANLCREIRASMLLAGPMLARCGHIYLPLPGGDVIGRRRVDTHLAALRALG
ncbi:MAG: UDP-N-acetylglucosamine 1-carboxyvinyltransferase, partial [Anaerolineae bacterium]|nr:UDP-N-acetylglucosamine 1-carboxyvinyltransferase [Anaerolineae bacterium]